VPFPLTTLFVFVEEEVPVEEELRLVVGEVALSRKQ
jgi:hypothetical protein